MECKTMINKFCDLWMIQPYDWHEPMLAETEQEAKQYAKQWIIKEYELSEDIHISERYYNHKQKYVF